MPTRQRAFCMVGVAQLVRAPGCGPGCRGFESPHSPHAFPAVTCRFDSSPNLFLTWSLEFRLEMICDLDHVPSRAAWWRVAYADSWSMSSWYQPSLAKQCRSEHAGCLAPIVICEGALGDDLASGVIQGCFAVSAVSCRPMAACLCLPTVGWWTSPGEGVRLRLAGASTCPSPSYAACCFSR
jgi:hypothetical protein